MSLPMIRTRIAPSPTGYLHVGNVRTALVNWLFARQTGGKFLLRIDDTDQERSRPEFTAAIEEDLRWLGLSWDEETHQSARFDRYRNAADRLTSMGRLYACYETPEELDIQRKMLAGRGLPPVYNRAGLKLSEAQKKQYESEGRTPHWRFLLEEKDATWEDLIRGHTRINPTAMSDPVLLRADGIPVYTLASVVDDGELAVSHIIRGEDHVSNTAVQIQLFEALGFPIPQFAHLALLKTKDGELSKRLGGNDIRALRTQGILPMAVSAYLATIGTSDAIEPVTEIQALIEKFSFTKFGRAPAHYDAAELFSLNQKLLHRLPFEAARSHLPPEATETFWHSVRGNIASLSEAGDWWRILHEETAIPPAEVDFLGVAAHHLPPEPWNAGTYEQWIDAVKTATGRKGKELFLPLRLALTGMERGPELKALLPLLGRQKTSNRLIRNK